MEETDQHPPIAVVDVRELECVEIRGFYDPQIKAQVTQTKNNEVKLQHFSHFYCQITAQSISHGFPSEQVVLYEDF